MTKHLHRIHHKHVAGEGVESWITCDGDRSSACHFYPDPDSETWEDGWTERERIEHGFPHDECIYVLTAKAWECAMLCGPDGETVHNGPIIPSWNGDCMVWEYAEEETPMRDPKTYAKLLSRREHAMAKAAAAARQAGDGGRAIRAAVLQAQLLQKIDAWRRSTGWVYSPWHDLGPRWTHTTIIPDTEEEA